MPPAPMSAANTRLKIGRDKPWGRPLVETKGGKLVAYTRASTVTGALEDMYNLQQWQLRMVCYGIALKRDLQLAAIGHYDDRDFMKGLIETAMDAAGANEKRNLGTAIHRICDLYDSGVEPQVPNEYLPDIHEYLRLTSSFIMEASELFCVADEIKVAGTPDRVIRLTQDMVTSSGDVLPAGTLLIADIKGLALDTPLPTPSGWTTMGVVRVGDQVLGSDGQPCTVRVKSPSKHIGTYVVTFDDGSQVTCDAEHIWWVSGGHFGKPRPPRAVGIEHIRDNLRDRKGQAWWRVAVAEPLELPAAELPIDPYLYGCWLGDGSKRDGCITKGHDLFEIIAADGHGLGIIQVDKRTSECVTRTVVGLKKLLDINGLLGRKHLPQVYLRGSLAQRTRLLQGLMDTDGTWNTARKRAVFGSTDKQLATAVMELLATLGQRPHLAKIQAHGYGKTVTAYHVEFLPIGIEPFRLPRKRAKFLADSGRVRETMSSRRVIVSVERGPDVPTACIGVDSPNNTYLCGEQMIPTHNTGSTLDFSHLSIGGQLAVYCRSQRYELSPDRTVLHKGEELPAGDRVDWVPGERLNTKWGLVIHLPAGEGSGSLHWINLTVGWQMAQKAMELREIRRIKNIISGPILPPEEDYIAAAGRAASLTALAGLYHRAVAAEQWNDITKQAFSNRRRQLEAA